MSHLRGSSPSSPRRFAGVSALTGVLALTLALLVPAAANAAVTVSRAEVRSGALRLEGSAAPNRSITVDGVAMGTSDGSGSFRISRSSYRPPADCTVDVDDGSRTPVTARLSGCTVSTAPPPAAPLEFTSETGSFQLGGEVGQYVIPLEVGTFANRFFNASGGTTPYRWTVTGTVPPGMSFIVDTADGALARIGGTPTTAGTFAFTLTLTDSRGAAVSHDVTATIGDGTLPPPTSLSSLTLAPTSVTAGGSSTATVTLGVAAPSEGAFVSLASGNRLVATVPDSVTVPPGATTATFPVSTVAASASATVTISATWGGVTRSADLTVTAATTTAPDTVSISRAEYDSGKRALRVEASSNRSGATLRVYVTSSDVLIGTLSGTGGTFSLPSNPQSITVKSSLGGAATRTVTAK